MVSPQTSFHSRVMRRLADAMELAAPHYLLTEAERPSVWVNVRARSRTSSSWTRRAAEEEAHRVPARGGRPRRAESSRPSRSLSVVVPFPMEIDLTTL
jgi:hypothetical protein